MLKNLTGIGYVTYLYASGLSKRAKCNFFYVWYFSKKLRKRPLEGFEKRVNLVKKYLPRPYILTHAIKTLIFNLAIFIKKPDLIFQPNYNLFRTYKNIPSIIIVHDLSHLRYPSFHPNERVEYFNKNLLYSIQKAKKVIAISEFTKNELIELKLSKTEDIEVIYNGVTHGFKPLSLHVNKNKFFNKHKLKPKEYLLFVGTFEPRKNISLLLKSYMRYKKETKNPLPLVLVGTIGWKEEFFGEELKEALDSPSVKRLGYLSDEELKLVYAGAKIFVFPSFYEGFGLPPLEAMASGTAVITSNASSIPEIVGDAGVLIDPYSKDELYEAIKLLDADDLLRFEYERRGIERAKKFDWEESNKKLFALCRSVVDGG